MRALVAQMLEHWVVRVLQVTPGGAFSEFERLIIQDGRSFGIKESLSHLYPGRFKSKGPAAVELHVSMDLLGESLSNVVLTPDTFSERAELPAAEELSASLLLADRGYFDLRYLAELQGANAHFIVRACTTINPTVRAAYRKDDTLVKSVKDESLKELRLPRRKMLDLDVVWGKGEKAFRARVLVSWNAKKKEYRYLEAAVEYLAANARRAHPKRDRKTGRLQLSFEPVLAAA